MLQLLLANKITEQQLAELSVLMEQPENSAAIEASMKQSWQSDGHAEGELPAHVYDRTIQDPRFLAAKKMGPQRSWLGHIALRYAVAAVILACCSLGFYFYRSGTNTNLTHNLQARHEQNSLESGHVVLTLSNGEKLVLDQSANGQLGKENNALISKTKDGQIVYDLRGINAEGSNQLIYNTIETPAGSTYQLILSDGTKAWLNAKSTLKFPVAFSKTERKVELEGEAYFEVTPNQSKPFLVEARAMQIQVLGTHFNVAAYADDQVVRASLVEGAIKAKHGESTLLLKPGEQANLISGTTALDKTKFNIEEVTDWKNGYFIFRDEPITEIMKKVSRWYNVDIVYKGANSNQAFGGKYVKSNSLEELL
ncbi:MAG: FecR family protein, partial [Chitinophagaceae bacterium]